FKGFLQRTQSDVVSINIQGGLTIFNAARDLYGLNQGVEGIWLYFANLPNGTAHIRISRATESTGPWTAFFDEECCSNYSLPIIDSIDGSAVSYYYKLEVFDAAHGLLKTYDTLYITNSAAAQSGHAQAKVPATVDPIVNTAFITDAIYEDSTAMTVD